MMHAIGAIFLYGGALLGWLCAIAFALGVYEDRRDANARRKQFDKWRR